MDGIETLNFQKFEIDINNYLETHNNITYEEKIQFLNNMRLIAPLLTSWHNYNSRDHISGDNLQYINQGDKMLLSDNGKPSQMIEIVSNDDKTQQITYKLFDEYGNKTITTKTLKYSDLNPPYYKSLSSLKEDTINNQNRKKKLINDKISKINEIQAKSPSPEEIQRQNEEQQRKYYEEWKRDEEIQRQNNKKFEFKMQEKEVKELEEYFKKNETAVLAKKLAEEKSKEKQKERLDIRVLKGIGGKRTRYRKKRQSLKKKTSKRRRTLRRRKH